MKEEVKLDFTINMKDYRPPRKTLWDFFWYCVYLFREENSMIGYIRENGNVCDDWQKKTIQKVNEEI